MSKYVWVTLKGDIFGWEKYGLEFKYYYPKVEYSKPDFFQYTGAIVELISGDSWSEVKKYKFEVMARYR